MTNDKKLGYFSLGVLTAILGWVAYTLYHIFGKPVMPIEPEKQDFSKTDWEGLAKTLYNESELTSAEIAIIPATHKEAKEILADAGWDTSGLKNKWGQESLDPHSLDDLIDTSKDTQPIKIDLEPSAKDLEDWAEYIE